MRRIEKFYEFECVECDETLAAKIDANECLRLPEGATWAFFSNHPERAAGIRCSECSDAHGR